MNQSTSVTLPCERFAEITNYEVAGCVEVAISLGCADFAKRDIPDNAGAFPVHLSLKTPEGRFFGSGAYCGFVHGFDQDILDRLWQAAGVTLDEDALYQSCFDVNIGTHEDNHGAVCEDCLRAGGGVYVEGSEDTPWESLSEFDRLGLTFRRLLPESDRAVCWSCRQMIDESIASAAENCAAE
jgi:hypothetical protein